MVVGNQVSFDGETYRCAVGKGGFSMDKKEGDGCTPLGVFPLRECWYRGDRISAPKTKLPIKLIRAHDGWSDDPSSAEYNRHILIQGSVSDQSNRGYETLWREDHIYDPIVPMGYNDGPVVPGRGSAIFLHIAHDDYHPTEGCIALAKSDLLAILPAMDVNTTIEIKG